jgi:hypothetical protein
MVQRRILVQRCKGESETHHRCAFPTTTVAIRATQLPTMMDFAKADDSHQTRMCHTCHDKWQERGLLFILKVE